MQGTPTRMTAYDSKDQAQAMVNKCYTYLNNFISANFGLMTEACTDLWYCNTSTADAQLNISPANPGHGSAVWRHCYGGVMCCNEVIDCLELSTKIAEQDKKELQAEARALRALYYYYLTNVFNGVPYYDYMVADFATQDKIQALPRRDANEIRKELYDDLLDNALPYFTEENGLKAKPSDIKGNRAGYALSLMMMAKFAMWIAEENVSYWGDALYALEELESLYGNLEKYPLEETSWNTKNVPESIFELQHAWSATGVQYTSSYATLLVPPSSNGLFDGVALNNMGEGVANWATFYTTKHFITVEDVETPSSIFSNPPVVRSSLDKKLHIDRDAILDGVLRGKPFDRRLEYIVGFGNLQTGETFSKVMSGSCCYPGPKYWCSGMVSSKDANNYKLFRYADALLMMAECHARNIPNNLPLATRYLNQTRMRAGLEPFADNHFTTRDEFMAELYDERARELAGELHRKFDMVRWGIWWEWMDPDGDYKYNSEYAALSSNIRPFHEYYPIPDTECALSNYVLTNEAYK